MAEMSSSGVFTSKNQLSCQNRLLLPAQPPRQNLFILIISNLYLKLLLNFLQKRLPKNSKITFSRPNWTTITILGNGSRMRLDFQNGFAVLVREQ